MKHLNFTNEIRRTGLIIRITALILLIFVPILKIYSLKNSNTINSVEEAITKINNYLKNKNLLSELTNASFSIYKNLFNKDTEIRTAFTGELLFRCREDSYLFFIDEAPWATYKHPVRIGLINSNKGEIFLQKSEWWPVVNGESYFTENSENYINFKTKLDRKIDTNNENSCICDSVSPSEFHDYNRTIENPSYPNKHKLWAIIILGAKEDSGGYRTLAFNAAGMYSILANHGVPEKQILYIKQQEQSFELLYDEKIRYHCVSTKTIGDAINEVKSKISIDDKFLFFISTHGGEWSLEVGDQSHLNPDSIDDCQMQKWLSEIKCKRLIVILNSCHSGSFISQSPISEYSRYDISIPSGNNNKRIIITSCRLEDNSPADIDSCDINKSDQGSEFIGGFFEAFTNNEADCNSDQKISIGEAFNYGKKYARCGKGSLMNGVFQRGQYQPLIKCSPGINPLYEFLFSD